MTLVEYQSSACSASHHSAHVVRRVPAEPGNVLTVGGAAAGDGGGITMSKITVILGWVGAQNAHKRGCAQCAHPGLRIRLYRYRTGPDWGGFRGSGGFSRAGARFESHLGHDVSPRQRRFCFDVLTKLVGASL
jgi:hypothetical protein